MSKNDRVLFPLHGNSTLFPCKGYVRIQLKRDVNKAALLKILSRSLNPDVFYQTGDVMFSKISQYCLKLTRKCCNTLSYSFSHHRDQKTFMDEKVCPFSSFVRELWCRLTTVKINLDYLIGLISICSHMPCHITN